MAEQVIITCMGDSAIVEDLGLLLQRGQSDTRSQFSAMASRDLKEAVRQGLVSLRETRPMPPHSTDPQRVPHPGEERALTISRAAVRPDIRPPGTGPDHHQNAMLAVLREILGEVKGLRADLAARPSGVDPGPLLAALQRTLPVVAGSRSPSGPSFEEDAPQFIPSVLTDGMGDGRVTVHSTETGLDGSLDDAAALLKARKRGATRS